VADFALQLDHRSRIHLLSSGLANGTVLADDVLDTFDALKLVIPGGIILMGNHREEGPMHPANRERLDQLFQQLDGSGIFRHPGEHGAGPEPYQAAWSVADPSRNWCAETARILQKLLVPRSRSRPVLDGQVSFHLPAANASDRRAALRSLWNPLVPDFQWHAASHRPRGLASIYLDVSGSMNPELELLTGLLWRLRRCIQSPFHASSNQVTPPILSAENLSPKPPGAPASMSSLSTSSNTGLKSRSSSRSAISKSRSARLLVNPNGPFFDGGSNSDNGQTGRKLVADYHDPAFPSAEEPSAART
jgi:hypothetical protein